MDFLLDHAHRALEVWKDDANVCCVSYNTYGAITNRIPAPLEPYAEWKAIELSLNVREGIKGREAKIPDFFGAPAVGAANPMLFSIEELASLFVRVADLNLKYPKTACRVFAGDDVKGVVLCPFQGPETSWCVEITPSSTNSVVVTLYVRESKAVQALELK